MQGTPPSFLKSGFQGGFYYERMWQSIQSGQQFRAKQVINKRKNGSLYYLNKTINPILDDNGNVIKLLCIDQEIDKKSEEDEDLRLTNERYSLALDASSIVLWEYNFRARNLFVGQGLPVQLGYQPDEFEKASTLHTN